MRGAHKDTDKTKFAAYGQGITIYSKNYLLSLSVFGYYAEKSGSLDEKLMIYM